jgi:serine/threonine protein phosphatase 1
MQKRQVINLGDNTRAIVLTDIHGCMEELQRKLKEINFCEDDVLVIAGDAIDRGPDSLAVVNFIAKSPNVYCIRGNHEDMLLSALYTGEPEHLQNLAMNGGMWALMLAPADFEFVRSEIRSWPLTIEINKGDKRYGVIHAEPDSLDWNTVGSQQPVQVLWGRARHRDPDAKDVENVDAIFCGHNILDRPKWTGNVLHMDMGAFLGNKLHHVEL